MDDRVRHGRQYSAGTVPQVLPKVRRFGVPKVSADPGDSGLKLEPATRLELVTC